MIATSLHVVEPSGSEESNEENEEERDCIETYREAIDTAHKPKRFAERRGNLACLKLISDLEINFQEEGRNKGYFS